MVHLEMVEDGGLICHDSMIASVADRSDVSLNTGRCAWSC